MKTRKCRDCGKVFYTNTPKIICDECALFRKPSRGKPEKVNKKKKSLTISEVIHVGNVYNAVKGVFKHYGDVVAMIDSTKVDCCVCCGEIVPEGRIICPNCEDLAKKR